MPIRPYTEADLAALKRMHEKQGFNYEFPDLANPLFLSKVVFADGANQPLMAVLARLTAEAYLLMDLQAGTPRERLARFSTLHAAAERDLFARGLDDVHCWLPPRIAKSFGRRLERIGWVRDDRWTPYCRCLAPEHL